MFRRNFLQRVVMAGTTGLGVSGIANASGTRTATYRVKGFSCITCAVGLDTMLAQQKGVVRSKSTYPDGIVTIDFDPREITGKALAAFITGQGFQIAL